MKASELIEKLHQAIDVMGDIEVEFYCDHLVPPQYGFRPAQSVGKSDGVVEGKPHKSIVIFTFPAWTDEKVKRAEAHKAQRDLEIAAAKREQSFSAWFARCWASRGRR